MYLYNCGNCETFLVVSEMRIEPEMVKNAFHHRCPVCSKNLSESLRWRDDPLPIHFDRRCSSPILLHIET